MAALAALAVGISCPPPNSNSSPHPGHRPPPSPPPRQSKISPSRDPVVDLLQRCRGADHFPQIHARIIKSGRHRDGVLLFKVLRSCSDWGAMDCAAKIFENIEAPDVYHYTAIIAGKMDRGACLEAICLYARMVGEAIRPDSFVVSYVLRACALGSALEEGKQVHGQVLKHALISARAVRMRLLEFYRKCGEFESVRKLFGEMPNTDAVPATIAISCYVDYGLVDEARAIFDGVREKDTTCWTAMIDGFARNGRMNKALKLFREMQMEEVKPNEVTIVCVLSACSQLGALELGRWVHSYVGKKNNIRLNAILGSALVDMYSKCGSLEDAQRVFREMNERDVVSYNSMIAGLAMHGRSTEAVELFRRMVRQGLRPTVITFVGVLNACSHGGLVDLGFDVFESMTKDYGIEPQIEHYGCMVDLLGRVGRLQEAYDFIKKMRVEPDHVIWGSLLGACMVHRDLTLGEKVAGILISNGAADSGTFVLLSNVYSSFGKWEEAARIRDQMRKRGVNKEPGCSSIEVDNEIHEFLLGDIRHPQRREIYRKLEHLNQVLRLMHGYSPSTEVVLQDVGEVAKEWALSIHSERLAICFGLISTREGTTIRVVKNLRVCDDCHSMIKLIAKVTGRKIVVRDRSRFHHFENGACSCGDFW
ncbi:hypothetical protein Taro_003443 [Colocasia esculenta]|uniref:DYW domain-containing protein n=1 Tax=Colocasia esculenta TaxID=4460 RepID=A0A843TM82_COLES|nr:hypothetical protein [Colocasia esculenta]